MAEAAVVIESLSEQMKDAGALLVRKLDSAGFPVRAALWFYIPDSNRWRFIVASPLVKANGPRKAYKKIQSIISRLPRDETVIDLQSISAVDVREPLISLLRTAVRTGDEISGIRFSRNIINGVMIEDAYIYRLR